MGNLRGAMEGYMQILKDDPQNADALYYIAVVAVQEGQYPDGISLPSARSRSAPRRRACTIFWARRIRGSVRRMMRLRTSTVLSN